MIPLVKLLFQSDTSHNFSALRRNGVLQDGHIPPAFRHSASIGNSDRSAIHERIHGSHVLATICSNCCTTAVGFEGAGMSHEIIVHCVAPLLQRVHAACQYLVEVPRSGATGGRCLLAQREMWFRGQSVGTVVYIHNVRY